MKKILFNSLLSLFILFGLSGCYTIIWSPDTEFPNEGNSEASSIYYGDTYYGPYYIWYDVPWWLDYTPPISTTTGSGSRDNNTETGRLRDTGNGRGESGRVIDVQPPSKNENPTGDNTNKDNSNNSGNSNSSDRSSSSGSGSSSGNSNSSGSGSTRNSDGGRSSGGRR